MMPLSKMKNYFRTSRKSTNQDKQQVNKVGDKRTSRDAREGQVIEKQSSINSTTSAMQTQEMEEIRAVILHYEDDIVQELTQTYSKGIIQEDLLVQK